MRLTDLSPFGGYVDTPAHTHPGDQIELTVRLDGNDLSLTGRVTHVHGGVGFGFALDLDDATTAARQQIADFLGHAV